jgi:hypothetical protein
MNEKCEGDVLKRNKREYMDQFVLEKDQFDVAAGYLQTSSIVDIM